MHDVAALAERLLALPSPVKVASAPVPAPSAPDTHEYAVALRKIAHLIRVEGVTVSHFDLDDVLSGAAVVKIASDETSEEAGKVSTHPVAIEARALAAELRKFASAQRREKIAADERALELAVIAEHEKRASEYVSGHPPAGSGSNPQHTNSSNGIRPGTVVAMGIGGGLAHAAYPEIIKAMKNHEDAAELTRPLAPQIDTKSIAQAIDGANHLADDASNGLHSAYDHLSSLLGTH